MNARSPLAAAALLFASVLAAPAARAGVVAGKVELPHRRQRVGQARQVRARQRRGLADGAALAGHPEFDEGEVVTTFTASLAEAYAMIRRGDIDHALVVAAFAHLAIAGPAGP